MSDDLLTRARAAQNAWSKAEMSTAINELIAEVERLLPLAELWSAVDALMPTTASAIRKTVSGEEAKHV